MVVPVYFYIIADQNLSTTQKRFSKAMKIN